MYLKCNCWDSALVGSFYKNLKCELVYGTKLMSIQQMKLEVFEYIDCKYNMVSWWESPEYLIIVVMFFF